MPPPLSPNKKVHKGLLSKRAIKSLLIWNEFVKIFFVTWLDIVCYNLSNTMPLEWIKDDLKPRLCKHDFISSITIAIFTDNKNDKNNRNSGLFRHTCSLDPVVADF